MDIAGFRGPLLVFALNIVEARIGVYCFSRGGKKVHYVGRSDSDLRARMMQSLAQGPNGGPPYTHFWYRQEPSALWAYRKECQLYHQYSPPDNANHPQVPPGTNWRCPEPSCSWA